METRYFLSQNLEANKKMKTVNKSSFSCDSKVFSKLRICQNWNKNFTYFFEKNVQRLRRNPRSSSTHSVRLEDLLRAAQTSKSLKKIEKICRKLLVHYFWYVPRTLNPIKFEVSSPHNEKNQSIEILTFLSGRHCQTFKKGALVWIRKSF